MSTVEELKNSPEILKTQFQDSLEQLGYAQLKNVECSVQGDEMVLTGSLNSFYLKQVAQSVAMKVPGVRCVRNEIHVE